jgi:hypothetical protein
VAADSLGVGELAMTNRKHTKAVDEIPPHLPRGKTVSLGNIGPEDLIWTGDDGTLDPWKLLAERGWHPEPPLQVVCDAIIRGNTGSNGVSDQIRLETAVASLTGARRKRGHMGINDYDVLAAIGWRYFLACQADRL